MRAYIIEYQYLDKTAGQLGSKLSQEGYSTLEAAQAFVERKPGAKKISPMLYDCGPFDKYLIHDVFVKEN